ncbi:MAG: RHS repeat protein, partial [Hydrococcus sp. SU_1_0]|nr:RHS repeat protein [Hydrococcus sp. SU_1_0]
MGQESLTLYNKVGNIISTTDFNGEIILYEYNTNNQLTKKLFEDGTSVEFNYDNVGRLESIVDDRGTTDYTYNERGNLLSRTEPDGKTISYAYNDSGKLESIITDSQVTSYTYDSFNFLDKVTANGEVTDYDYDVLGNLMQTTLANGVVETREYDELYRLIGLDNTDADGNVISSYDYTLDAVGNRTLVGE